MEMGVIASSHGEQSGGDERVGEHGAEAPAQVPHVAGVDALDRLRQVDRVQMEDALVAERREERERRHEQNSRDAGEVWGSVASTLPMA